MRTRNGLEKHWASCPLHWSFGAQILKEIPIIENRIHGILKKENKVNIGCTGKILWIIDRLPHSHLQLSQGLSRNNQTLDSSTFSDDMLPSAWSAGLNQPRRLAQPHASNATFGLQRSKALSARSESFSDSFQIASFWSKNSETLFSCPQHWNQDDDDFFWMLIMSDSLETFSKYSDRNSAREIDQSERVYFRSDIPTSFSLDWDPSITSVVLVSGSMPIDWEKRLWMNHRCQISEAAFHALSETRHGQVHRMWTTPQDVRNWVLLCHWPNIEFHPFRESNLNLNPSRLIKCSRCKKFSGSNYVDQVFRTICRLLRNSKAYSITYQQDSLSFKIVRQNGNTALNIARKWFKDFFNAT
jgi:hypothetical protein